MFMKKYALNQKLLSHSIFLWCSCVAIQHTTFLYSSAFTLWVIMLNNCDVNIEQNNRDYDFCHNPAALPHPYLQPIPFIVPS